MPDTAANYRMLHTMFRVKDLDKSLAFYTGPMGMKMLRKREVPDGKYTLAFVGYGDESEHCAVELTYNWPAEGEAGEQYTGGRNFGHLAYRVDDIYATCQRLMDAGVTINRPPRDGYMAFVRTPDLISIELLQEGGPKAPAEPWASMPNTGEW